MSAFMRFGDDHLQGFALWVFKVPMLPYGGIEINVIQLLTIAVDTNK